MCRRKAFLHVFESKKLLLDMIGCFALLSLIFHFLIDGKLVLNTYLKRVED